MMLNKSCDRLKCSPSLLRLPVWMASLIHAAKRLRSDPARRKKVYRLLQRKLVGSFTQTNQYLDIWWSCNNYNNTIDNSNSYHASSLIYPQGLFFHIHSHKQSWNFVFILLLYPPLTFIPDVSQGRRERGESASAHLRLPRRGENVDPFRFPTGRLWLSRSLPRPGERVTSFQMWM